MFNLYLKHVAESQTPVIESIAEIPQVIARHNAALRVRWLKLNVNGIEKDIVFLGEMHLSSKRELHAVNEIYPYFDRIGAEGVSRNTTWDFNLVMNCIHWFYHVISVLSLGQRSIDKSIIRHAENEYSKKTVPLEKDWKPPLRTRLFMGAALLAPLPSVVNFIFLVGNHHYIQAALLMSMVLFELSALMFTLSAFLVLKNTRMMRTLTPLAMFAVDHLITFAADLAGIGRPRNLHMCKKIVSVLQNPDIHNIVMATGAAHTLAMEKMLVRDHGAVQVKFERG